MDYYYKGYCPLCDIEWACKVYDTLDPPENFGDSCPHCGHHITLYKKDKENE